MERPKKGDYLVSKQEAWEIMDVSSGIYLVILRMASNDNDIDVGSKATFSHSHIKHRLVSGHFFVVPKGKASTIKVLYS